MNINWWSFVSLFFGCIGIVTSMHSKNFIFAGINLFIIIINAKFLLIK
jgi:hypothetical protein